MCVDAPRRVALAGAPRRVRVLMAPPKGTSRTGCRPQGLAEPRCRVRPVRRRPRAGGGGGGSGDVGPGRGLLLALGLDQAVEPGDVVLGRLGAVLDERTGVDVEALARGPHQVGGEPTGQLGPPALEQGQAGRRGQVAGEGQAQAEAAGVVGARRLLALEELLEQRPTGVGDPVHLAGPLRPERGTRAPGPQAGALAAEGAGGRYRRAGARPNSVTVTAPDRSRRDSAG